jgi:outer membrane protein assembly factor BamB
LVYAPPHACACYIKAKLSGFYALAGEREQNGGQAGDGTRLEKGPAYGQAAAAEPAQDDWPTYRHDAVRSGYTESSLPVPLYRIWQADIGGRLTSPVAAGGKLFIASIDAHRVCALDASSGQVDWHYTAGGRVDSPPTIYNGLVIFGSADGWVYCLRASDGQLVWRFRAAREQRRVVAREQVESVWPVHGSVLVQNGVVYFAAGRSSFLDGGIYLYRLEPETGNKLSETCIYSIDPATGKQPKVSGFEMDGVRPDVLSSDGSFVYMRHKKFYLNGDEHQSGGTHLFSPTGFLDGSWFHRSYWLYANKFLAGWSGWWQMGNSVPSGRLLVFDGSSIYGFGRHSYAGGNTGQLKDWEKYRLFAVNRSNNQNRWSKTVELMVRSMVLADDTLFVAGPPDLGNVGEDALAAYEGENGGVLWAVATADGSKLAQHQLESIPVFDGMAAADGRLYIALKTGRVIAMGRVPPEITELTVAPPVINENDFAVLYCKFTAQNTGDAFDVCIDWGDGSTATTMELFPWEREFQALHRYLDDDPRGTASDEYTITVTISAEHAGEVSGQTFVTVNNVPAEIGSLAGGAPGVGDAEKDQQLSLSGEFTDVGTLDTHEAEVDWGDGVVTPAAVSESGGSGTFSASHAYQAGGIYTVRVTVKDDDNGATVAEAVNVITGARVYDGVLQIVGTDHRDKVSVNTAGGGSIKVHASFLPFVGGEDGEGGRVSIFDGTGVARIVMLLGDGDDHASIAGNIQAAAFVDGGAGADNLIGGGGDDILLGAEGNDTLLSGTGGDLLVGGSGRDRLVGGPGDDLMIGARTGFDIDDDAVGPGFDEPLRALLAEWTCARDLATRMANIIDGTGSSQRLNGQHFLQRGTTVLDDGEADLMTGFRGRDWLILFDSDKATDGKGR